MLSKNHRLSACEFDTVFKDGTLVHTPHVMIRIILNTTDHKISVAVSKKYVKTAVARNRIRRLGYNTIREFDQLPAAHVICMIKKSFVELSQKEQKGSFIDVCKKIKAFDQV